MSRSSLDVPLGGTYGEDMALLLVSVRSVAEAETALAGGADIIDIKEPSRGSLGRADDATIRAIVERVAGRAPLSAALGELLDNPSVPEAPLNFVKMGVASCRACSDWRASLGQFARERAPARFVPVAYADAERASAPDVSQVLDFAIATRCTALLIDTWEKDARGLLHWLPMRELVSIRKRCTVHTLTLGLAGSLLPGDIERLLPLQPDIIAVRGAACRNGVREAGINLEAVGELSRLCHSDSRS